MRRLYVLFAAASAVLAAGGFAGATAQSPPATVAVLNLGSERTCVPLPSQVMCDGLRAQLWAGLEDAWASQGVTDPEARFKETAALRAQAGDPVAVRAIARALGTPYVKIVWLRFVGNEPGQRDEAIGIANLGGGAQDMTGWSLRSPLRDRVVHLPAGLVLQPGERCYVYTGLVREESCGDVSFDAVDVWPDDMGVALLVYDALALPGDEARYSATLPIRSPHPYLVPQTGCNVTTLESNREAIAAGEPDRKRQLTPGIVALRVFALHGPAELAVVLYHLPSGSQIILDQNGQEVTRNACDLTAERELDAVLRSPTLLQQALALVR